VDPVAEKPFRRRRKGRETPFQKSNGEEVNALNTERELEGEGKKGIRRRGPQRSAGSLSLGERGGLGYGAGEQERRGKSQGRPGPT